MCVCVCVCLCVRACLCVCAHARAYVRACYVGALVRARARVFCKYITGESAGVVFVITA